MPNASHKLLSYKQQQCLNQVSTIPETYIYNQHRVINTEKKNTHIMSSPPVDLPGGFIPRGGLPSPAPSAASSNRQGSSSLPHPRSKSLRPGSNKEDMVRRYVEERLLNTSRRYVKKFGQPELGDSVVGYTSFSEVCKDLDSVINVLWLSGTRTYRSSFEYQARVQCRANSSFSWFTNPFPTQAGKRPDPIRQVVSPITKGHIRPFGQT